MGQNQSNGDKAKPLVAQSKFEPTIHRRFIKERVVTIELEEHFWTKPRNEELEIKDLRTGQVLFRLPAAPQNAALENEKKLLLDAFGVPILGMQWSNEPKSARAEYIITPGGATATEELYRFGTMFNPYFHPLALCLNKGTPEEVTAYVVGKWRARQAVFGIQRGERQTIYKIGEVNAVGSVTSDKYRIDIAPGVDIALILLFAAAMDEQAHRNARRSDNSALKLELKREKKMREAGNNYAAGVQGVPTTVADSNVNTVGNVGAVLPASKTIEAASVPVAQAS